MTPDILEFLRSHGCQLIRDGNRWVTSSPIKALSGSIDKTPSFTIYPDGKFHDFSTGERGDIWTLHKLLGGDLSSLPQFQPAPTKPQQRWPNTVPDKYLDISDSERQEILEYAEFRRITEGYLPGCYYRTDYTKRLALMFIHEDNQGICGAKFRCLPSHIAPGERKCIVRGKTGFYKLENTGTIPGPMTLYLVESESSANSLWMLAKSTNRNVIILSHGSVSIIPKELPYEGILDRRLIIDQDDDDKLYSTRVAKYSHLNLTPVTLNLGKEDMNSLWASGRTYLIEHLI